MRAWATKSLAAALAAGMTIALAALSQVPYASSPAAAAEIRLAWRARGARVEECRAPTPDDLRRVPAHMRQDEICEGRVLPYRLAVRLDGRTVSDRLVRGGGARQDRPLYVFETVAVAPGAYELSVHFVRQGDPPPGDEDADTTPARLELDRRIELGSRDVVLVTYDPTSRALLLRERGEAVERRNR